MDDAYLLSQLWTTSVVELYNKIKEYKPNVIVGIEAKGSLIAAAVACMNKSYKLVHISKDWPDGIKIITANHGINYLSLSPMDISFGDRVALIDDTVSTGASAKRGCQLIVGVGAEVCIIGCITRNRDTIKYKKYSSEQKKIDDHIVPVVSVVEAGEY